MSDSTIGDKERLNVLLEEYKTLRQESLNTITSRVSIMGFSFATLAVIGSVTVTAKVPDLVAATTLGFVVPYLAKSVTHVWLGEYSRSQRAGDFIADLERRINALASPEKLSWESHIRTESKKLDFTYKDAIRLFLMLGMFAELFSLYYMNDAVSHLWFISGSPHHRFKVFVILAFYVLTVVYIEEASRISIRKEYATALNYALPRNKQVKKPEAREEGVRAHAREAIRTVFEGVHDEVKKDFSRWEQAIWRLLLRPGFLAVLPYVRNNTLTLPEVKPGSPPLRSSEVRDDNFVS